MITSFFPGRVRLRAEILKDVQVTEKALEILRGSDAVKHVENNYRIGSVLLEYFPEKVPMEKLSSMQDILKDLQKLATRYSAEKRPEVLQKLEEFKSVFGENEE